MALNITEQTFEKLEPQPLMRQVDKAADYPVESLGTLLCMATIAIQAKSKAPMAICAQSVLASAALVAQGHVDVELPTGSIRPSSLYFMSIAASGERKSTVDRLAMKAVKKREHELFVEYTEAKDKYQADKRDWDADYVQITKGKGKDRALELEILGPEPDPPRFPLLVCEEPNKQGLIRSLNEGSPSQGVFSAEGGAFIGGNGMKHDNKMDTAASFSDLWDGETIKKVRSGGDMIILPGRRISVHLMAQKQVAREFIADSLLQDQGLLARFLIVEPDTTAGTRLWEENPAHVDQDIELLSSQLYDLLKKELPIEFGTIGTLEPKTLKMTPEARSLWIEFSNSVEMKVGPKKKFEVIQAFANKAAEHAARIAAVISFISNPETSTISELEMKCGIDLMTFYLDEAYRITVAGNAPIEVRNAQKVLDWMHSDKWGEPLISLPDIYQKGPNCNRAKKDAQASVKILEEHGWLHKLEGTQVVRGRRRQEAWRIEHPEKLSK